MKCWCDRTAKAYHITAARGSIGALCALVVLGCALLAPAPAHAVPAYARQTGEPCAACHNGAFPQLTPFGREFKLNGYTAGGRTCSSSDSAAAYAANRDPVIPLSAMVVSTFTHTQGDQESPPANRKGNPNGLGVNDNWMVQDTSIFLAGQLFCKVGSFAQATYDRNNQAFFLDNTDVRFADQKRIGDHSLTYGLDVNNNPTVEDPWNTTPAWRIPGGGSLGSAFAPGFPTPWIDNIGGIVHGEGGYLWLDNTLYLGLWDYQVFDDKTIQALGEGGSPGFKFDGPALYWRAALEHTFGAWTLMGGVYGMHSKVIPDVTQTSPDDAFTDLGYDAQVQYLHGKHFVTGRISLTHETYNLAGSTALPSGPVADNPKDWLSEFNVSATYSYDSTYSVTGGYFSTDGSTDLTLYQSTQGLSTNNGSPKTAGEFLELGYSPFSKGGPRIYPWFNTRLGLQYWHYDKINGNAINYDPAGRNASADNTFMLFSWTAF